MPSVSASTCLKDAQAPCIDEDNLIQENKKDKVADIFASGHKSNPCSDDNHLNVDDKSGKKCGKNHKRELNQEGSGDETEWIHPDLPSRCTWRPGAPVSESPHSHPPR